MLNTKYLIVAIISSLIIYGGGIYYFNNMPVKEITKASPFTYLITDGKVTKSVITKNYTNELFPKLLVPVEGESYEVTENDKNANDVINKTINFKQDPVNLTFSFYSDNGGRDAGAACFRNGDVAEIDNNWYRESLRNQQGEQLGYLYVHDPKYTKPADKEFDIIHKKYTDLLGTIQLEPIPKTELFGCSSVHRVSETITSTIQKNNQSTAFVRIIVDQVIPTSLLQKTDKLISNTKI